jgi:hypothetical protein
VILSPPDSPGFVAMAIKPESVVASSESGFSKKVQVYDWGGKRWTLTASLGVMNERDAKAWRAFFLQLNGRAGTFYLGDSAHGEPLGAALGSPVLSSFTTESAILTGLAPSVVEQFAPGDWLQIGDRLYAVTEKADSDATGACVVKLWPSIPVGTGTGSAVVTRGAVGEFRLTDFPEQASRLDKLQSGFEFSATSEV